MSGFRGVMTSGTLMKVQNALGLPMSGGSVFTSEMGVAMEAYLATRGAPTTKPAIVTALLPWKTISADGTLNLSDQSLNDAADAYMKYKGFPADGSTYGAASKSWLAKNWMWLAGGGTLLAGAVAGAVWYWKREGASGPTNGLGCGCGLGRRR